MDNKSIDYSETRFKIISKEIIKFEKLFEINILEIIKSLEELKFIDPDMIKIMGTVHKTAPKRIIDIFEAKLRNLES